MNKLRELLYDESGQMAEFIRKCHEEQKVKKGCSTCKNIRHVIDYPGFVTGEENECTAGLTCDTVLFSVTDCPKWEEQELKGDKK